MTAELPRSPGSSSQRYAALAARATFSSALASFEQLGDLDAAATREALEIYRGLAKARPDAFLPYVAQSLGDHGPPMTRRNLIRTIDHILREIHRTTN